MSRKCLIYKGNCDMGPTHTTLAGQTENGAMGLRGAFLGRRQLAWTKMNESCSQAGVGVPLAEIFTQISNTPPL